MSNQFLKLRRSSVPGKIPDTSSLDFGEIALNTYDGLAFMKKSGSNGQEIVVLGASTGSFSGSFTGSLYGTASWAYNSISSSYASTASNILGGKAPHVPYFITDTTLATSSIYQSGSSTIIINQDNATSVNPEALYVYQPSTSSFNVISGKGNLNNYLQLNIQNTNQGTSASSDVVATADNGNEFTNYIDMGINGENYGGVIGGPNDGYLYSTGVHLHIGNATPGQYVGFFAGGDDVDANMKLVLDANNQHQITGSLYVSGSVTAFSFTGSLQGTSSFADNATNAYTASYTPNYLPLVGGGTLSGGNITITQDLIVQGTASIQTIQFVSQSSLNIGTNIITVNTSTPTTRFGGLAVYDSGSTGTGLTGSLLWDSQNNVWIYTNPSGAAYDGAMVLMGPRNTSGIGNEVGIGSNYLAKGNSSHHVTSSQIIDDGTTVSIPGNLVVTGSITGTVTTASYALQAVSASYASTSSYSTNFTIAQTLTLDESLIDFAKVNSSIVGSNNLFNQPTGSWTSAHGKYTLYNGANARAGEFMTVWNGTSVTYYDNSTTDIGNTTDITFQSLIVSNQIQINAIAASSGWAIKMITTYL